MIQKQQGNLQDSLLAVAEYDRIESSARAEANAPVVRADGEAQTEEVSVVNRILYSSMTSRHLLFSS